MIIIFDDVDRMPAELVYVVNNLALEVVGADAVGGGHSSALPCFCWRRLECNPGQKVER